MRRRFAVQSGIVLFFVSGTTTIVGALVTSALPGGVRAGLLAVGAAGILTAVVASAFRRASWPEPALLALLVPALALLGFGNFIEHDPYRAPIYLFVMAVWVGFSQRRGTNLALAPVFAAAYWLPLWLAAPGPLLDRSVPYVVLVAVASGETVAWLTSRLAVASDRLRLQDQRRFAVLDAESSAATLVLDQAGTVLYVSASVDLLFGYRAGDLEGRTMVELLSWFLDSQDRPVAQSRLEAVMARPSDEEVFRGKARHADGSWRHVEIKLRNRLADDVVGAVVVDVWDVTDRVQAQASRMASEESFRLLFQQSPLPSLVVDAVTGRCLRVNNAACAHYGYSPDELRAMTMADLAAGPDQTSGPAGDQASSGGCPRPGLGRHRTKDGRLIDVEVAVNATRFGEQDAAMVLLVDVTEQRQLEDQLRHQTLHDALTGLANRALLHDRLDRALAGSARQAHSVVVLCCDLDDFKLVNDSLGQTAGDEVLQKVAAALTEIVRPGDTVARLSADEFAVVLELVNDPGDAQTLAERIISVLAQPIVVAGQQIRLSASVGIAFGTSTVTADELCRSAEAAMREAKESGKGCYRVFEAAKRPLARRRLELSNDLRVGLDQGQFRLQYQPHVSLSSGELQGFEALVRWDHPVHGTLHPAEFIPIAEESGLIVPLGRWILETACQEAVSWSNASGRALTIAVNLSVRQLRAASVVDDVRTALALSGLAPGQLVLEITESVFLSGADANASLLDQLHRLGVRLAIDDFGTGYSSLGYLRQFHFDVLKIDRSFVDDLLDHRAPSSALIRTIVTLGHTLGMQIIAEGIETVAQYRELALLGADAGQGYLMSRPIDACDARELVARPTADQTILGQLSS